MHESSVSDGDPTVSGGEDDGARGVVIDPSPELLTFLDRKLDTYEKLELVLVLRAAGSPMTLADVAVQLQVGPDALRRVVKEVAASGVIDAHQDDQIRLRPGPWDPLMAEAAQLLATEPNRLLRALTRIAMERIRGRAARTFADAFQLRKKGD